MQNGQQIQNINLQALVSQIKDNSAQFELITITHIFREFNVPANTLSKQGLQLEPGYLFFGIDIRGGIY